MKLYNKLEEILKKAGLIIPDNIMYIAGPETLPPPLTSIEEAELLLKYENGDKSIRNILIERNLRLVVYIAKRFENTGINIEDLISIGTIGLIKGINTYSITKNTKLATYASRCIENEILMHLRKVSSQKTEISFDEPLNTDRDGNELLLSDILSSSEDSILKSLEDKVDMELLKRAVQKLSSREQTIISMRFGLYGMEEKTQKDIADLLGISQSYISRLEKRIIKRIGKYMAKF